MSAVRPRVSDTAPDLTMTVTNVAEGWLQDCVREHLSTLAVSAADLAAATGRSASNWRNKLNGTRPLQVEDLLMIAMTVDPDLFARPPFDSHDLTGYFPPLYRKHLSHTSPGRALPTFDSDIWGLATATVAQWLHEEHDAGRDWLIDAAGLAHRLVQAAAEQGLPSTTATLAGRTDDRLDIEWIAQDLIVRVATNATPGAPATSDVRQAHKTFVEELLGMSRLHASQKLLTHFMTPTALATLGEIAAFADPDPDQISWQVLPLGRLHQLARDEDWTATPDIHLRVERYEPDIGLLCLWIK